MIQKPGEATTAWKLALRYARMKNPFFAYIRGFSAESNIHDSVMGPIAPHVNFGTIHKRSVAKSLEEFCTNYEQNKVCKPNVFL
jgi:hypothetical protein